MSLIEIKKISKTYGQGDAKTTALKDIDLEIKEGEFLAIMGPSGSGKSTLLHILGFLDKSTTGNYLFEGKKIEDYTEEEKAQIRNEKIGFVFQAFNLLPKTNVLENIKLPLFYSNTPEKEWHNLAIRAGKSVGLEHRLFHDSTILSGGEKQRVAIARALVTNPKIIFADEPTGNLDSKSGQAVMEILEKLNADGKTIILITHETYTAEHAERIIRLKDGQIEEEEVVKNRLKAKDTFIK